MAKRAGVPSSDKKKSRSGFGGLLKDFRKATGIL
jgi:hypothetical protein